MSKKFCYYILIMSIALNILGYGGGCTNAAISENTEGEYQLTEQTKISDVINDPLFSDYGRLIFPANDNYYSGEKNNGIKY